ncbi:hypothetical protein FGG08_002854 [Glutinoglossum americanum]|uniref:Opioid growth factor receptor (OGFr) conserved domain-containing protein n=1 Tax=Glutinoglossum americanum TaxID=1670608 RepID=A0A9P8IAW4_9PEZI|nr:hypothetical protein FGG08_002854 [Glutinoglossum americanum]
MASTIVNFYDPLIKGHDHKGRTLDLILGWPDSRLEASHNYIQVLFPIPEPSPFNRAAPLIDRETFEAFRARPELRARLKKSFHRFINFLGFEFAQTSTDLDPHLEPGDNIVASMGYWFYPVNHNHLRITRVLRCLRILGLENEAEEFFDMLGATAEVYPGKFSKSSMTYWARAALRPLYASPEDGDVDESKGLDFLVEFERKRAKAVPPENKPKGHKERENDFMVNMTKLLEQPASPTPPATPAAPTKRPTPSSKTHQTSPRNQPRKPHLRAEPSGRESM